MSSIDTDWAVSPALMCLIVRLLVTQVPPSTERRNRKKFLMVPPLLDRYRQVIWAYKRKGLDYQLQGTGRLSCML